MTQTESMSDEEAMMLAISLGERGRVTAPPNPWVGCVILNDGHVVGKGYHHAAGEPHAEVHALKQANRKAKGATVYVTLEPCSHFGRTPPCANALIEAQVARVCVALEDPDTKVRGQGIAMLRKAGIQVETGLCQDKAFKSLEPYLHHRKNGRPFCIAKAAISIDGRTSAADGTSKWITPKEARADSHKIRAESQAIMIGSGTALADAPSLTVRDAAILPPRQPLRVLLDAAGKVPAAGPLFDTALAPTLVLTTLRCPQSAIEDWLHAGAEVEKLPEEKSGGGIDLIAAMDLLGSRGIIQVLVEGGAHLHGSLLKAELIDRLIIYTGSLILGEKGAPLFSGFAPQTISEAKRLTLVEIEKIGDCIKAEYALR